ncbi:hypothetical protein PV08_11158 [Exophiala spinifera]|uniref:Mitochondrial resolvase Ydc2 catalytic domain-containing protein n=1 Tax=Exophiala spinifera TaxID=91928 RepID=A0A0D1ZB05_9EURO|nr:uncharacterized protein PV08_11158 [Exophiala spinifera]KIW10197.1 hypothetical protein PV08_11158 [Exophiala spinifera]
MPGQKHWLEALTLEKLHRLAVTIGSPCSGTKAIRVDGIRNAVKNRQRYNEGQLSLLSIDMGIRNLAYAHFIATKAQAAKPTLQAWNRLSVSKPAEGFTNGSPPSDGVQQGDMRAATSPLLDSTIKESFEPDEFARHSYILIKHMLQTYKPDVVLIERQRFRSGGRAAVPEWTIRVGVFEGMLYAVLRTLVERDKLKLDVQPMLPTRVNRYWLEGPDSTVGPSKKRATGREVKSAKIDIVGRILEDRSQASKVDVSTALRPFAQQFVSVWKKEVRGKKGHGNEISKLDDLADCFLQGLAWIHWQNNRQRLDSSGADAVDPESGWLM